MSNSKVITDLKELQKIRTEKKRMLGVLKELKKSEQEFESSIHKYLAKTGETCVQFEDTVVYVKDKKTRLPKDKDSKTEDCVELLSKAGVDNPSEVFASLIENMRGEITTKPSIHMKDNSTAF